jgi:hypothetical protein
LYVLLLLLLHSDLLPTNTQLGGLSRGFSPPQGRINQSIRELQKLLWAINSTLLITLLLLLLLRPPTLVCVDKKMKIDSICNSNQLERL